MIWRRRAVSIIDARVATPDGVASSIRFGRTVLSMDERPGRGDSVVSAEGAWVLPGLVNAHDHLELNHFGRQAAGAPYANVRQWVSDMRPRLHGDPSLRSGRAKPLAARLFAGGLKNLLAGVTLVAHHNPLYPGMGRAVPVGVVRRYGWAHSLGMQTAPVGARGESGGDVRDRHARTSSTLPFIVHAAEGCDEEARQELDQLARLEVLTPNTSLVHVVAATDDDRRALLDDGVGLIWCPGSNLTLFGQTWSHVPMGSGPVALGTDSRLTGTRDLLDELQLACQHADIPVEQRMRLVTDEPARLLRHDVAGRLTVGGPANLIVLPPGDGPAGAVLSSCRRADLQLVVVGGRPAVGTDRWGATFEARGTPRVGCRLDDQTRTVARSLVDACRRYVVEEPGFVWGATS